MVLTDVMDAAVQSAAATAAHSSCTAAVCQAVPWQFASCLADTVPITTRLHSLILSQSTALTSDQHNSTMTAGGGEEWMVVGGKGKPRKPPQQQQKQRDTSSGILAAASTHVVAEATPAAGILPGWEHNHASAGGFTYSSSGRGKGGHRRQQHQQHSSSPEQRMQKLQAQILDIARELKQADVYQSLLAAMQRAAGGHPVLPQQQQQQHPNLDLPLQQQQQQEQHQHPIQQQQQQQQQQSQQQQPHWEWSSIQQLVVYGLGCIEDSKVSRHQLAMVLLLQELLPGLASPPQLYDPAFSPLDCQLLQQMGMAVIATNEEGRRSTEGQRVLFFLPHCEGVLCDNLLAANWSPGALSQLAILGNSFATYHNRWSGPPNLRPSTTRPDRLLQLVEAGVVCELPVPDHKYPVASAFNDMSLHCFSAAADRTDAVGLEAV